jgi:glycosyltransferase involved in cell wall biosynthesis
VKITACMMVKNEERNLRRCLDSIRGVVDELIVVDTGSSDGTVAIAEEYGARIYHSPWRDDFSFHRNESLSYATGDWVLVIDADEELVIEGGHDLRAQLATVGAECDATRMWLQDMQGGAVAMSHQTGRFFRRGRIAYKNAKHNMPVYEGPAAQLAGVKILHYGYDKDQTAGKMDRDLALLLKARQERPDDYQVLFYLSQTYGFYGKDPATALRYLLEYIEVARDKPNFNVAAYVSGAEVARNAGEVETSDRLVREGLEQSPDSIDLHFLAARYAATSGRTDEIDGHAHAYLVAYDRLTNAPHSEDSRFLFFYDVDSLLFILQLATVSHTYRGLSSLSNFRSYLSQASGPMAEELARCMAIDLAAMEARFGVQLNGGLPCL